MNFKQYSWQWCKALAMVAGMLCVRVAMASDTISMPELQTQASLAMQIINFVMKWGGLFCAITGILVIGSGKAKGEMGSWMATLLILAGGLAAAYSWFNGSNFGSGFVW